MWMYSPKFINIKKLEIYQLTFIYRGSVTDFGPWHWKPTGILKQLKKPKKKVIQEYKVVTHTKTM